MEPRANTKVIGIYYCKKYIPVYFGFFLRGLSQFLSISQETMKELNKRNGFDFEHLIYPCQMSLSKERIQNAPNFIMYRVAKSNIRVCLKFGF